MENISGRLTSDINKGHLAGQASQNKTAMAIRKQRRSCSAGMTHPVLSKTDIKEKVNEGIFSGATDTAGQNTVTTERLRMGG